MLTYTYFNPEDSSTHPTDTESTYLLVGTEGDEPMHEAAMAIACWDATAKDFAVYMDDGFFVPAKDHFCDPEIGEYLDLYYTPIPDPRQH